MSREVRTVRPFQIGDSLDRVLEDVVFQFGSDECSAGGRIQVNDVDDYCRRRAELAWASEEGFEYFKISVSNAVAAIGIDPGALALLVTVATGYLKITEVVFRHPLSDLDNLSAIVNLSDPRPKALRTGFHGAKVAAYLLLTEDIDPQPLRPWRKGTWLARAVFRLVSTSPTSLFRLTPLDQPQRDRLGLPQGVVRYIDLGDYEPRLPYDDLILPDFYVDEDLLASLATRPNSRLSRFIQVQLVQDFIWGVLRSPAVQEENFDDLSWEDLEDTLLGRMLSLIAGSKASNEQRYELIRMSKENPDKVLALAEDAIGLREELLAAVNEEGR